MDRAVQVGIGLPRGSTSPHPVQVVAQLAEALDYDSVWATEHIAIPVEYASRYPFADDGVPSWGADAEWFEAMVTLGYVAAITERIRLGTSVITMLTRDPLSLAKQAATIDCLSGGRLELGVGAGWLIEEAQALGHPTDQRAKRLEEAIVIMRKAWSEHPVQYSGEFYSFPPLGVSPKPVQGADLPIWVGGLSPMAQRITTKYATGNIVANQPPEKVAEIGARLRAVRQDVRIAALIYPQDSVEEAGRQALALRAAGADRLILLLPSELPQNVEYMSAFATRFLPRLHEQTL